MDDPSLVNVHFDPATVLFAFAPGKVKDFQTGGLNQTLPSEYRFTGFPYLCGRTDTAPFTSNIIPLR